MQLLLDYKLDQQNAAKVADKAAAEAASAAEKTAEQPLADWEKDLIKAPTETAGA
jgi:small subunit ribosomal protein S2